MSLKTKINKGEKKLRKKLQRDRVGTYYVPHQNTSKAGITYWSFGKKTGLRLPKPTFSLGIIDKFFRLTKKGV